MQINSLTGFISILDTMLAVAQYMQSIACKKNRDPGMTDWLNEVIQAWVCMVSQNNIYSQLFELAITLFHFSSLVVDIKIEMVHANLNRWYR